MHYPAPKKPSSKDVRDLVLVCSEFSDRGEEGLQAWADEFVDAHLRAPGGLSIEVGTRIGGSALLFGGLLEHLYGESPPPLWTVDPYGGKPYVDGFGGTFPGYGDDAYLAMRQNLGRAPYHAHWLMKSDDFFQRMYGLQFWRPGTTTVPGVDITTGAKRVERMGERYVAGLGSASFILHDGEHSMQSILSDVDKARYWLKPGGALVIDNTDSDPDTIPALSTGAGCWFNALPKSSLDTKGRWAILRTSVTP